MRINLFILSFKRFSLIVLVASFVASGALFAAVEYILRTRVIDHDPVTLNLRSYLEGGRENVVFGDSHVGNGANGLPDYGVFWQPGISASDLEQWVARYLEHNEVERVIVQLAPHMFRPDPLYESDYDGYLDGRMPLIYVAEERFSSSLHKYFLDLASIIDYDLQPLGIYQPNGSYPRAGYWYELPDEVRSDRMAVRVDTMSPSIDLLTEGIPYLDRTMAALQASEAEVCVAIFPLAHEYADAMETSAVYMDALGIFRSLALKYGARYTDLSRVVTASDHIFNQDHLNIEGGEAFGPVLESACFG
jgi:hypothetical protein